MVFVGTALPGCHLRVVLQPWCGSVTPQLLGSTALPCIKLNIGGVQKGKEKTGQRINWEYDKGSGVRCPDHVAGWAAMSQAIRNYMGKGL